MGENIELLNVALKVYLFEFPVEFLLNDTNHY